MEMWTTTSMSSCEVVVAPAPAEYDYVGRVGLEWLDNIF